MSVQRGDVVLVNYPFASGGGSKVRPALVIQCDRNNRRLDNTIIAQITSRTRYAQSEPTQVLVRAASTEGQQAGLIIDSSISCENLYTVRQDAVFRRIGSMPASVMAAVSDALKASPRYHVIRLGDIPTTPSRIGPGMAARVGRHRERGDERHSRSPASPRVTDSCGSN